MNHIPRFGPNDRIEVQLIGYVPFSSLTYKLGEGQWADMGQILWVPMGAQRILAVVIGEGSAKIEEKKLKSPGDIITYLPPISEKMLRFLKWISDYYMEPSPHVFKLAFPMGQVAEPLKDQRLLTYKEQNQPIRLTAARKKVINIVQKGESWAAAELAAEADVSISVIAGLEKQGLLQAITVKKSLSFPFDVPRADFAQVKLSSAQQLAADELVKNVKSRSYSATLLDGVPGSGKTEVYFEMIAQALKQNQQILVMLPEIALSAQWLKRFQRRFGVEPAIWHSELTSAQRRKTWQAVILGQVKVVVGARSSLFLPFADLGCIIVDEEHDTSYKQEEGVTYNGRDMAVVRAYIENIPIVLATATPSLESWVNQKEDKYKRLHLESRFGGQVLPDIHLIDMRNERPPKGQWITESLSQAITEKLQKKEQVLLFLNRRGYAPLTLCFSCGHKLECDHCAAWMVEHKKKGRLMCHHCGFEKTLPPQCPSCEKEDTLIPVGPGVERIMEEVQKKWPDARIMQASSDVLDTPHKAAEFVKKVENNEVDIIVGTQLVSRGYHFPNLTLVGVIDADAALGGGDLRAAEHSWQLLWQVAGRAGRAVKTGDVYLQTYLPQNPVMKALVMHDRSLFMEREVKNRQLANMPPFGRLAAVILSDTDENRLMLACRHMQQAIPSSKDIFVLGPATPSIDKLRGRYRRRFLVMAAKNSPLQSFIHSWLTTAKTPPQTRVKLDIDPYNFM